MQTGSVATGDVMATCRVYLCTYRRPRMARLVRHPTRQLRRSVQFRPARLPGAFAAAAHSKHHELPARRCRPQRAAGQFTSGQRFLGLLLRIGASMLD